MTSDRLSVLDCVAVFKIGRDPRSPESVAAGRSGESRRETGASSGKRTIDRCAAHAENAGDGIRPFALGAEFPGVVDLLAG